MRVEQQQLTGVSRCEPEMTTKHGKLKVDRRAKLQQMYLDDLAFLENFNVVRYHS